MVMYSDMCYHIFRFMWQTVLIINVQRRLVTSQRSCWKMRSSEGCQCWCMLINKIQLQVRNLQVNLNFPVQQLEMCLGRYQNAAFYAIPFHTMPQYDIPFHATPCHGILFCVSSGQATTLISFIISATSYFQLYLGRLTSLLLMVKYPRYAF